MKNGPSRTFKNTIINNNSGSILISGERGTGKTAFVYKVIKELKKHRTDKEILPVLINANQIYKEDEKIDNKFLIENLIRRLYAEIKDRELDESIKNKLNELYKKVEWDDYKIEKKNKILNSTEKKDINSIVQNIETKVDKNEVIKILVLFGITAGSVNYLGNLLINYLLTLKGFFFRLLLLIIILFPIVLIYLFFTKISIKTTYSADIKTENIVTDEFSEYYKKDKTIGSLEHDLNSLLEDLNNKNHVLFIIDELDKISGDNKISHLIKMYKNLFTLSKANFIFITDQKFYLDLIGKDKSDDEKPTLFSFKYYLDYPSFNDLRNYMEEIILRIEEENKDDDLQKDDFINYLLFLSNNDFFKLKETLHSLIIYNSGEGFIDSKKLEENDRFIKQKLNLYNLFELLYNKYKSFKITLFHENYIELKELFLNIGENFRKDIAPSKKGKLLTYILTLLKRHKVLKLDEPNNIYRWTGIGINIPNLEMKTNEEKKFINNYLKYVELINRIYLIGNFFYKYSDWKDDKFEDIAPGEDGEEFTGNIGAQEIYKKYYDDYKLLTNGLSDKFIPIDVLNESINDLKNNITNLQGNYYNIYVNIIKKIFDKFSLAVINNKVSNIDNILSNRNVTERFSRFRGNVIFSNQVSYKIILINNFNEVNQLTNDEIKFLDEKNIILVNIHDEKFSDIEKLSYFMEKEGKSKLGKIFPRKVNYRYSKIINITYNLEINNFVKDNFERLYFGINIINKF